MRWKQEILFPLVNKFNSSFLQHNSRPQVFIPFHHLISDAPVDYIEPLYSFKNSRQFEQDLDYLLKNFRSISLTNLADQVSHGIPVNENSFLITFDDGLRQAYEEALPILLRKGIEAAFFIVPSFLDNKELFYDFKKGLILNKLKERHLTKACMKQIWLILQEPQKELFALRQAIKNINYLNRHLTDSIGTLLELDFDLFLKQTRPFMSTGQVNDMISKGFHIGAHSMTHPLYSLIPQKDQVKQTCHSVEYIKTTFKLTYTAFAFPHLDQGVSASFFDELNSPEAEFSPDLIFGNSTGGLEKNPKVFHRFIGENPQVSVESMIKTVQLYQLANKMIGRNFIIRQ